MATEYKLSYTAQDINNRLGKIDSFAEKSEIPSKTSELANDSGFATEDYVSNSIAQIPKPNWNQTDETAADFIKNKPVVTVGGDTLEWDGNQEGLVCVGDVIFKVSDAVPTAEDVANGAVLKYPEGSMDITFIDTGIGILVESNAGSFVIVSESGVGAECDGLIFPEAGTYQHVTFTGCSLTIPGYTGFGKEQIDPAVLPESDIVFVQLDEETNNVIQPMTELWEQQKKGKTLLVGGIGVPFIIGANEDDSISDGVWTTFIGNPYDGGVLLQVVSCKYNAEGTVTSMGYGIIDATMG